MNMSFGNSEESIQLVTTLQNNRFQITREGKKFLNNLDKPIAIVSIAGMYRTGKSYLVNKLIKTKQNGFRTGATTQACTKGLSIWSRPIPACDQKGRQFYYVVVDSQGIGSCDQELKYDMKLLTLVFLLSSTVIYNSMGPIDEQILDQLRVITNLKSCVSSSQFPAERTKLVWVLRDFALQLVDRYGCEMTANEYLQQCLQDVVGGSMEVKKKNEIRRAIRNNLGQKKCFTLVRPTIKEEELADLTKCKLRTQFLSQIEAIRQEVFKGSFDDVKKINDHPLNGKLLGDLIQRCVSVLNSNGLPELPSIWQSVKEVAYEQFFDTLCIDMKHELSKINLPVSKEELKLKLNQVENKYYVKMEEQYLDGNSFKKYHREFLKVLQKINKEVKKNNEKKNRDKIMAEVRGFVKENIVLSNVQPTNLSLVKTLVDRMQLKIKGEPEGYEYVLSILFDLMHISEQKSISIKQQLCEYRQIVELASVQKKNSDLTNLAVKNDYHEALVTIRNLKITQKESQKEIQLVKNQLEAYKFNMENCQQQWERKEASLLRQIQDNNFKARQKVDDVSITLKQLRQENTLLSCELSQMRQSKLREGLNEKKQLIFEERMKETWDRFDEERKKMRAEIDSLHKDVKKYREKYEEERKAHQKQALSFEKDKQIFAQKQKDFVQQLKQIQKLHAETKKTYNATFDTIKDKDRILRSIENVTMSHSRVMGSCKKEQEPKEDKHSQKYWEDMIEKTKEEHREETRQLRDEVERLKRVCDQQRGKAFKWQMQVQGCREEKEKLEKELIMTSQRFADTVSEIQHAKEKQRSLYEESIVRLLSNLDKREGFSSLGNNRR